MKANISTAIRIAMCLICASELAGCDDSSIGTDARPADLGGESTIDPDGAIEDGTAASIVNCNAGREGPEGYDPELKQTVNGNNGTFVEECDSDGNLIEYQCEIERTCLPTPGGPCDSLRTGEVETVIVDCSGTCVDGVC